MGRRGPWIEEDRDDLREAMARHGHGQGECADRLEELGLKADQSAVSKWLSGGVKRPRTQTVAILRAYIEEAGVRGEPVLPPERDEPSGATDASMEDRFDAAVSAFTDEPLLGPRQGALVDALTQRLASGVKLSSYDDAVRRDLFRVLNLGEG